MVRVSSGSFEMGPPGETSRRVDVDAFCIDRTEVTVASYEACTRKGACPALPTPPVPSMAMSEGERADSATSCNAAVPDRPSHPLNCVDWKAARTFCKAVGKRLPTEAEWTWAARGKGGRPYPWGATSATPKHWNGASAEDGWTRTAPVGSFPSGATPEGVLDMAGNVAEWTSTRYCDSPNWPPAWGSCTGASRLRPDAGDLRVVLGGDAFMTSWLPPPIDGLPPSYRVRGVGFRCAKGLPKGKR